MAKNKNILDKIIEQSLSQKPQTIKPGQSVSDMMALPKDLELAITKAISDPETLNNVLTIASIAALFIPLIGPAVSAGISLGNAGLYAGQGKTYEAGLEATFALIPGLGKLAKLTGVAQLGKQGMKTLAGKLIAIQSGKKVTLDATEKLALKSIAANKQLVETEVKKGLAARVVSGAGKVTARISTDVLATMAYDQLYIAAAGGITLNQWLENWWDAWSNSPITESTDIYKQIVDQISLNEQMKTGVDWMDNALAGSYETDPMLIPLADPSKLKPRVIGKDASGRDVTASTPAEDGKNSIINWIDDNPIKATGTVILAILSPFIIRRSGKWLYGKITGNSKLADKSINGVTDITNVSDLQLIANGLTETGWKRIAADLQKIRAQIFSDLKTGKKTLKETIEILNEAGFLPKKWNPIKRNKFIRKVKTYSKQTAPYRTKAAEDAEKAAEDALLKAKKDFEEYSAKAAAAKKNPINYTITPSK
jgi:hypothetical protein